jgi:hypothetical protein
MLSYCKHFDLFYTKKTLDVVNGCISMVYTQKKILTFVDKYGLWLVEKTDYLIQTVVKFTKSVINALNSANILKIVIIVLLCLILGGFVNIGVGLSA